MSNAFCPYCMTPLKGGNFCPICGKASNSYSAPLHHLPPGTLIGGRYVLGGALGEGGFGITYIGLDLVLGFKVAVKEYYPSSIAVRNSTNGLQVTSRDGDTTSLRQGIDSFMAEARSLGRLSDQQLIVHANNYFEENGTAYIVMDYVEGITLLDLCEKRGGRLPANEFLSLIEPLFEALQELHEMDLVHRDISPDNIMLTAQGEIRLIDFGCARAGTGNERALTIMLKYDYAPIEQYTKSGQGPWTDVYAFAATIYRCLCGIPVPSATERLGEDRMVAPTAMGVELTHIQERGLLKGLAVQPNQRLQSARELHAALYEGMDVGDVDAGDAGTFSSFPVNVPGTAGAMESGGITEPGSTSTVVVHSVQERKVADKGLDQSKLRLLMAALVVAIIVLVAIIAFFVGVSKGS